MGQFCEKCKMEVDYFVSEEKLHGKLRGKVYDYYGKVARCNVCHGVVFNAKIQDDTLRLLYAEYGRKNNIIDVSKIRELLTKYNIFPEDMSMLLGWGETTYSWLCEGGMPSKEFSDELKHMYDDPNYFLKILEQGKNQISSFSYMKARKAAENLENSFGHNDFDYALTN